MTKLLSLTPLVATLAACASQSITPPPVSQAAQTSPEPAVAAVPAGLQSISYSTSPCFGACPTYAVTVSADGTGLWEGQRFVAVTGERALRVTPAQFAAFARALQPDRPHGERRFNTQADCQTFATDLDGVDIRWTQADGSVDVLSAYYGCDMDANRQMFERLRAAVRELPIEPLIRADAP